MKKPRLEDFDPNAAPPLGSPMDNYPPIERPNRGISPLVPQENSPISATVLPPERPEQSRSPIPPSEPMTHPVHEAAVSANQDQSNKRTKELSFERTKEIKNERNRIHHSFDIFGDQLMSLKEFCYRTENMS